MTKFDPKHRVWAILLLGLVVAGCALQSPLRMNPEFAGGKHTVTKVAILPPDVVYHLFT